MSTVAITQRRQMFAERLRIAMAKVEMTQAELARQMEITRNTVNKWCSGQMMPNHEHLEQVVALLHCSMRWITRQEYVDVKR